MYNLLVFNWIIIFFANFHFATHLFTHLLWSQFYFNKNNISFQFFWRIECIFNSPRHTLPYSSPHTYAHVLTAPTRTPSTSPIPIRRLFPPVLHHVLPWRLFRKCMPNRLQVPSWNRGTLAIPSVVGGIRSKTRRTVWKPPPLLKGRIPDYT